MGVSRRMRRPLAVVTILTFLAPQIEPAWAEERCDLEEVIQLLRWRRPANDNAFGPVHLASEAIPRPGRTRVPDFLAAFGPDEVVTLWGGDGPPVVGRILRYESPPAGVATITGKEARRRRWPEWVWVENLQGKEIRLQVTELKRTEKGSTHDVFREVKPGASVRVFKRSGEIVEGKVTQVLSGGKVKIVGKHGARISAQDVANDEVLMVFYPPFDKGRLDEVVGDWMARWIEYRREMERLRKSKLVLGDRDRPVQALQRTYLEKQDWLLQAVERDGRLLPRERNFLKNLAKRLQSESGSVADEAMAGRDRTVALYAGGGMVLLIGGSVGYILFSEPPRHTPVRTPRTDLDEGDPSKWSRPRPFE